MDSNNSFKRFLIPPVVGLIFLVVGMGYGATKNKDKNNETYVMTEAELQSQIMSFADRFSAIIVTALEEYEDLSPSSYNRRAVLVHTVYPIATAYTIAVESDPAVALLDMVVMVTLGRMIYETVGVKDLGKDVEPIIKGFRKAENDIWGIAKQVLTPDEQKELYDLIHQWTQKHPEVLGFSHIRFKNFASERRQSKLARGEKPTGLFKSVKKASQEAEEIRLLAERGMFLATRLPLMTGLFADTWASRLTANPDINQTLNDLHTFSSVAERLASSTDNLSKEITAQRKATVDQVMAEVSKLREETIDQVMKRVSIEREAAIDQFIDRFAKERKQTIDDLLAEEERIKALIAELRQTLAVGNELVTSSNTLVARLGFEEGDTSSEPFDIKEYQTTLTEASKMIQQADGLIKTVDQLMLSPGWENSLPRIIEALDSAEKEASEWATHAFLLGMGLIAAFFLALLVYRYASERLLGQRP